MRTGLALYSALALALLPGVGAAEEDTLDLDGYLAREASTSRMERMILRQGAAKAAPYRALSEFYAFRVPSQQAWNEQIGPALEEALDAERPLESLRSVVLDLDDSQLMLSGTDSTGLMARLELPGERGEGFISFAPPLLLGPDRSLTNLSKPGQLLALSGLAANELPRRGVPDIVQLGLQSLPTEWRSGELKQPRMSEIQDRGAGSWAKYRGRSHEEGEELEEAKRNIERVLLDDDLVVEKMRPWPDSRSGSDRFDELLRSARYRSRLAESDIDTARQLRFHRDEWEWVERPLKHPTRYAVFSMSVVAERDDGKNFNNVSESIVGVVFYTPFFMDFEEAHLYLRVAPESLAAGVQEGQLPFFSHRGSVEFYRGHLDRWLEGRALEYDDERVIRRSEVPALVGKWGSDLEGKRSRSFSRISENGAHWPLRMLPIGSDEDLDKVFSVRVDQRDLGAWLHRLVPGFEPPQKAADLDWTLSYSGEVDYVELNDLFKGPRVRLSRDAGKVASMPAAPKVDAAARKKRLLERERRRVALAEQAAAEEEASSLSTRTRDDESRPTRRDRDAGDERVEVENARRREEEARDRALEEERADERRRARDAEDARQAALDELAGGLEIELVSVVVGSPSAGKPYLVTRAGRTLPVKVAYRAAGELSEHKLQVLIQGYDLEGKPMAGFTGKSAEIVPREGDGALSTYIKIPRGLTRSSQMGSYRIETTVTLDGVELAAPHVEFARLGSVSVVSAAFLDPEVVMPADGTELMLTMDLGGWSLRDKIPVQVKVDFKVGKVTRTEEFTLTRTVGRQYLGVGIQTPEDLPTGEGKYTVSVTAGGVKKTKTGSLLVLDPEMVAQRRGYAGRGRLRIDDPSPEFDAFLASQTGVPPRREYVRPESEGQDEGDWDFGDDEEFDFEGEDSTDDAVFDDEFDLDSSAEELAEREREEEARRQAAEDRKRAKADAERRKVQEAKRREEERRRAEELRRQEALEAEREVREEQGRRQRAEEKAREKERKRLKKKADREKKKRKDLPPEDEDDFDFDDILDEDEFEEEDEGPTSARGAGGSRGSTKGRTRGRIDRDGPSPEEEARDKEDSLLASVESEQLDEEDLPDFVFFKEDEFDVLLAAESEDLGVLYLDGSASKRTLTWLEEWERAAGEGAPDWLWIIQEGAKNDRLRFRRFSNKSNSWTTVFEMPARQSDRASDEAGRTMMRRVFNGWVPTAERSIAFDKF